MMRFQIRYGDFIIAQFSGYRDAAEYFTKQNSYGVGPDGAKIEAINGAEFPDNCEEIVNSIYANNE